jgi:hypothetical protein
VFFYLHHSPKDDPGHPNSQHIHLLGLTEMSLFITFGCMNVMFLTSMAYDGFVAIYNPHDVFIVNFLLCSFFVFLSLSVILLDSRDTIWLPCKLPRIWKLPISSVTLSNYLFLPIWTTSLIT